ncbi:hypothetical protein TrLO_g245 [Triparma laevis f. longispina]|uniref:Uncharacterized protein n=1 Tax=Triparma laevis f. longispina TaxID=1714387 RepID=A0A9W7A1L4_9STRA|nr:hypothetical protein TrLO_g245 [Triparma laevis f. longispina]
MSTSLRTSIIKAISGPTPVVSLVGLYGKYNPSQSAYVDAIEALGRKEATSAFRSLKATVDSVLEDELYVPEALFEDADDSLISKKGDVVCDEKAELHLNFLRIVAVSVEAFVTSNPTLFEGEAKNGMETYEGKSTKKLTLEEAICGCARTLHDQLIDFSKLYVTPSTSLQLSIMKMCEKFYLKKFNGCEDLILNLLPLLLIKSCDMNCREEDVERVWRLREAFGEIAFEEEGMDIFKKFLMKTISSPSYLTSECGLKFLVHLFTLDRHLTTDVHDAVKSQLVKANPKQLRSYGEIYLRAWKGATEEEIRSNIEELCLQPLMEASMTVADANLAKNIRLTLKPLHEAKKDPEVDALLFRMYNPILWRNINAANGHVRNFACGILADTFPLHDPEADAKKKIETIQKGVDAFSSLLVDRDVRVRVAASENCAMTIKSFWDLLPIKDIRQLLNVIVTQQACDSSSPKVRMAAINGLCLIMENDASHGVLKGMLPLLANMIHDHDKLVKLAMVRLLAKVKTTRGIKFFHIVKVPHLHARLANEDVDSLVAKEMSQLLQNSYFPQGPEVTASQQMTRTIDFMKKSPEAAKVFYGTFHSIMSVSTVAKLVAMLLKCLATSVDVERASVAAAEAAKKKSKKRGADSEMPPPPPAAGGILNAKDSALMASICESIYTLWSSITGELEEAKNKSSKTTLLDAFKGKVLTNAHSHFDAKAVAAVSENDGDKKYNANRCCAALLSCAGNMPVEAVEGLVVSLTEKLRVAASTDDMTEEIGRELTPHIALLCQWGKEDVVCNSLGYSIQKFFEADEADDEIEDAGGSSSSGKNKKKKSKRKNKEISSAGAITSLVPTLKAPAALIILKNIMGGSDASSIAARAKILQCENACKVLESSLECARSVAEKIVRTESGDVIDGQKVDIIIGACEIYGRMALHKEASIAHVSDDEENDSFKLNENARSLLTWLSQKIAPALSAKKSDEDILGLGGDVLSPIAKSRPKQKKKTAAAAANDEFGDQTEEPVVGSSIGEGHALAVQLMKSGLVIFGEWLAVGGEGAGSAEIATMFESWGELMTDNKELRAELFLAYGRAFLQLAKFGDEARGVFRAMLGCNDLSADDEKSMKTIFAHAVKMNGKMVVEEVYRACSYDVQNQATLARTVEELIPRNCGVSVVAKYCMMLVLESSAASKEMVRFASTQLSKSETDGSLVFNERIVGVLVFSSHKSASREVNALCDKLEGKSWGKFGELVLDLKDKMLMA